MLKAFITRSNEYRAYNVMFELTDDRPSRFIKAWDGYFQTHDEAMDYANRMCSGVDSEIHPAPGHENDAVTLKGVKVLFTSDSGAVTLPWALLGVAGYMLFWMISHGVFQALTVLQR